MWRIYRRRFFAVQGLVLVILGAVFAYNRLSGHPHLWTKLAGFLVVLELAALVGAWWGARLERGVGEHDPD